MRTRYLLCLLSLLGLISACSSGSGSKQHQTQQAHYESIQTADTTLVGKRVYLEFDSNSSVVEYLSSRHLFWSSRDSVHGYKEGEDNYHAVRIGLHVFFVNWVESVYSGRDVNRGTVTLSGKITRIEDSNHLLLN